MRDQTKLTRMSGDVTFFRSPKDATLDRILTRQSQPTHDACPRARPDLGVIANDWLAPLAAGDRIPPSISGGVASARYLRWARPGDDAGPGWNCLRRSIGLAWHP